jgi:hypothetical protein
MNASDPRYRESCPQRPRAQSGRRPGPAARSRHHRLRDLALRRAQASARAAPGSQPPTSMGVLPGLAAGMVTTKSVIGDLPVPVESRDAAEPQAFLELGQRT